MSRNAAAAAAQFSAGRRGGHRCLLAVRCNADSSQGYSCAAASRVCREIVVVCILRDDRNCGGLWLSCDGLICLHLSHMSSYPKDLLWLCLLLCPRLKHMFLFSTDKKLHLPDVIEEEMDHFTQARNL